MNQSFYDRAVRERTKLADEPLDYVIEPLLANAFDELKRDLSGRTIRALDLGSGDTGLPTIYLLKHGAQVTVIDISQQELENLRLLLESYSGQLETKAGDVVETIRALRNQGRRFDLVTARSFLHHIPDTAGLMESIRSIMNDETSCFISYAEPLRYDTLPRLHLLFSQLGYYFWRLSQGNYLRGLRTLSRRIHGKYDENEEADMVEYHAVREGVDHLFLKKFWESCGYRCEIVPYFWIHSRLFTFMGRHLHLLNGFALKAHKFRNS